MISTREMVTAEPRPDNDASCTACDQATVDRPQRRSDVVLHQLDGEALLFDPEMQNTHRLNETGFLIWHSCNGQASIDDIAMRLVAKFEVDRQEAQFHVAHLVTELRQQQLLVGSQDDPLGSVVPDSGSYVSQGIV